jgi:hypothetical protein
MPNTAPPAASIFTQADTVNALVNGNFDGPWSMERELNVNALMLVLGVAMLVVTADTVGGRAMDFKVSFWFVFRKSDEK